MRGSVQSLTQRRDAADPLHGLDYGATLVEQFRMATRSNQRQFGIGQFIEQEPIGLNVAVPVPDPVAAQRMRMAPGRKRLLFLKQVDDGFQFVQIPALLADSLQVPLKRRRGEKREGHYTFWRSSRNER